MSPFSFFLTCLSLHFQDINCSRLAPHSLSSVFLVGLSLLSQPEQRFYGNFLNYSGREFMTKIVRVGVTFPPDLLKDLDGLIAKVGYESRSKAIQDAVRLFVSERKWLQEEKGTQAGVLMLLYDHEVRGLESELTHIQHHYAGIVCSTMHIHLSDRDCLEAIAIRGDAAEVRKLGDELSAKRGVKMLKIMLVSL
jgi:CopG family nickel-responsive transcriptional regulator